MVVLVESTVVSVYRVTVLFAVLLVPNLDLFFVDAKGVFKVDNVIILVQVQPQLFDNPQLPFELEVALFDQLDHGIGECQDFK